MLVVADPGDNELEDMASTRGHQVLQLHGAETPQRCQELRRRLGLQIWKALRIRNQAELTKSLTYVDSVDSLLLDAWVENKLGGTGQTIPISWLKGFNPGLPWWLAGGITAERIHRLIEELNPTGFDVSSGVENSPGDKSIGLIQQIIAAMNVRPENN